jgi:hypothetical protein
MTEQEWLASEDPAAMLHFLNCGPGAPANPFRYVSDRKLRLFGCAVCRLWPEPNEQLQQDISAAELAAEEGEGTGVGVHTVAAIGRAHDIVAALIAHGHGAAFGASKVPRWTYASLLRDIVGNPFRPKPELRRFVVAAKDMSAAALESGASEEEVWRSPWLTPPVLAVATAIYHQQMFDDLPILADALEEAGCGSVDLMAHLRGHSNFKPVDNDPTPWEHRERADDSLAAMIAEFDKRLRSPDAIVHVRGCWALDLILGKE